MQTDAFHCLQLSFQRRPVFCPSHGDGDHISTSCDCAQACEINAIALHRSHQAMGKQKSQRRKMHTQDLEPAKLTPSPRVTH